MGDKENKGKKYAWPFSYSKIKNDFLSEIESLEMCAKYYLSGEGVLKLKSAQTILDEAKINKIYFIGNTFSYFASYVPHSIMMESETNTNYITECFELSEFSDYIVPQQMQDDIIYIFISVSGSSRLIKRSIDHLKLIQTDPKHIWLVTNNPDGENHALCENIFPLLVESEVVLGTKTYFNSILVLYFLTMIPLKQNFQAPIIIRRINQLFGELKSYRANEKDNTEKLMGFLGFDFNFLYLISNGGSMSAAYMGALSAKSYCRFFAEAISRGLFFHGPFQLIDEKFRCILIAGDEPDEDASVMLTKLVKLITDKLGKGRLVLLNNNIRLYEGMDVNPQIHHISFTCEESAFSPIIAGYIMQFLMLEIAEKRGLLP
jgi:fructoselysine-6-P-deglycase FrlB-like protein